MPYADKLKRDGVAIVLFGLIVSTKTYFLVEYLRNHPEIWTLLIDIGHIDEYGREAKFALTGQFSYVLDYVTALAFDALVLFSFLTRSGAKSRPEGFWENWFPLFTVFVPVTGFTLLFIPAIRQMVPGYSDASLMFLSNITPRFGFYLTLIGLVVGFFGAAFSIWAISYLRKSFGLRTAVRELVVSGPYRRIRHPLYFGEILHILGIAILSAKPAGLYLFLFAVICQVFRAKIEERKFLRTLPEYESYMQNTGFLWPRLGKP